VLGLALLASGCGHKAQPVVAPPTPAMPAGVTWGAPSTAPKSAPAPAAASAPAEAAPTHYPNPPSAHPAMPVDNYSPDPRVGELWETGIASFYGPREQGNDTASGQKFDYHKMTAAHRLLPLGTKVKVTDLRTGKSVRVLINDRGPFWPNRLLDLSLGAARRIGDQGLDPVRIRIVSLPQPLPVGIYTVMVGWFTNASQLDQCRSLMQKRLPDRVVTLHSDEGRWLRYDKPVHLDMATATQVVRELRQRNFPAYLVRLN